MGEVNKKGGAHGAEIDDSLCQGMQLRPVDNSIES
jgi:hypothetical protein